MFLHRNTIKQVNIKFNAEAGAFNIVLTFRLSLTTNASVLESIENANSYSLLDVDLLKASPSSRLESIEPNTIHTRQCTA